MLAHPEYKETRTGQGCLLPHSSIPYINTGVWGVQPSRRCCYTRYTRYIRYTRHTRYTRCTHYTRYTRAALVQIPRR